MYIYRDYMSTWERVARCPLKPRMYAWASLCSPEAQSRAWAVFPADSVTVYRKLFAALLCSSYQYLGLKAKNRKVLLGIQTTLYDIAKMIKESCLGLLYNAARRLKNRPYFGHFWAVFLNYLGSQSKTKKVLLHGTNPLPYWPCKKENVPKRSAVFAAHQFKKT